MTTKITSFDELEIPLNLLKGIYANGWEVPSPVQQVGIIPVLKGNQCIIQAQSGTGKTGTFSIASLSKIDPTVESCQCIILSPTREIADQITEVMETLSHFMEDVNISLVRGNIKLNNETVNKSQVIVGTPGRILDMIQRGVINMKTLKLFILDEADEILNYGFNDQIIEIFQYVHEKAQIAIYSATIPNSILRISEQFMDNPIKILLKKDDLTLEGIKQFYIKLESETDKIEVIHDIYKSFNIEQSIVYCSTKKKVEWLSQKLAEVDFPTSKIHGDMEQKDRDSVMKSFRSGQTRILITTDLLARGIDVQHVCLVINYDLPFKKANYIHRIGRTGRYGRKGVAINFVVSNQDVKTIREIERYYHTEVEEMPMNIQKFF